MSLAADGQHGNGLQLENLRLKFSSSSARKITIKWPWFVLSSRIGFIYLCLVVHGQCCGGGGGGGNLGT